MCCSGRVGFCRKLHGRYFYRGLKVEKKSKGAAEEQEEKSVRQRKGGKKDEEKNGKKDEKEKKGKKNVRSSGEILSLIIMNYTSKSEQPSTNRHPVSSVSNTTICSGQAKSIPSLSSCRFENGMWVGGHVSFFHYCNI